MSEPFVRMRTALLADAMLTDTYEVAYVTPLLANDGTDPPYIVFSVADADQLHYSGGAAADVTQSIDLAVLATSYETAWKIARRCQSLLSGWTDDEGGAWTLESGPADGVVWAKEGSDRDRLYEVDLSFKIETVI